MRHRIKSALGSFAAVMGSALLTVAACSTLLYCMEGADLQILSRGPGLKNLFEPVATYLGNSIYFFLPVLLGYFICFAHLKRSLSCYLVEPHQYEKIRFYNGALEMLITLFFAIGVIFTAWGLQNALVSALAGLGRDEAGRLGAWGILKRLVDNGILIALWTTIVGGTGGYLMRMGKFFFLTKQLNRYTDWRRGCSEAIVANGLESIRRHAAGIERAIQSQKALPGAPCSDSVTEEG